MFVMRPYIARTCIAGLVAGLLGGPAVAQEPREPSPAPEAREATVGSAAAAAQSAQASNPDRQVDTRPPLPPRARCDGGAVDCGDQLISPSWSGESTRPGMPVEIPPNR